MEVTQEAAEQARRIAVRLEASRRYPWANRKDYDGPTVPCSDCGMATSCCHACDGTTCGGSQ